MVLQNINDKPFITSDVHRDVYENTIERAQKPGALIGETIRCTDDDALDWHSFSINGVSPNHAGKHPFGIKKSGQLYIAEPSLLNFEVYQKYTLFVRVTDNGPTGTACCSGRKHDDKEVYITVKNLNEAPRFDASAGSRSVPENSLADTPVGEALVTYDEDLGNKQKRFYRAVGNARRFRIETDGLNGQLYVVSTAKLNFEKENIFVVVVFAKDSGLPGPPQYGSGVQVWIKISDVNEPPELLNWHRDIYENKNTGTAIGDPLIGTDVDEADGCPPPRSPYMRNCRNLAYRLEPSE
jgi:hypothetical protein